MTGLLFCEILYFIQNLCYEIETYASYVRKGGSTMRQVMRVQWFQMRKDTIYKILLLAGMIAVLSTVYEIINADYIEAMDADGMLENFRLAMFVQVFVMDLVLNLDERHHVVNQDLMAGIPRGQLLFGKVIFSNIVALSLALVYTFFVTALIGVCYGIALEPIGSILIRFLLLLLLHFRIAGEVTLVSVLIRKPFVASVGYVIAFWVGRTYETQLAGNWISSVAIHPLLDCISYYRINTVYAAEGGIVDVIQYLPTTKEICVASIGSILIGGICLWIANRKYRKREF